MVPALSAARVLVVAATHVVVDRQVLVDVAWSPFSPRAAATGATAIRGLREVIPRRSSPAAWSAGAAAATRALHDVVAHSLLVSADPRRDTGTLEELFTAAGLTPRPWRAGVLGQGTADRAARCAGHRVEAIVDALTGARSGALNRLQAAAR